MWCQRKIPIYSTTIEEYKDLGYLRVGTIAFISCEDIIKRLGPEPMYSDILVKQFIKCHFGSMI